MRVDKEPLTSGEDEACGPHGSGNEVQKDGSAQSAASSFPQSLPSLLCCGSCKASHAKMSAVRTFHHLTSSIPLTQDSPHSTNPFPAEDIRS
jgi:hypothetical protein